MHIELSPSVNAIDKLVSEGRKYLFFFFPTNIQVIEILPFLPKLL